MPALSSYLSLPRRNKVKSVKSPFEVRRLNTPASPNHPYASPDIHDISHGQLPSVDSAASEGAQPIARPRSPSMQMKLEVELTQDSANWFPEHLFPADGAAGVEKSRPEGEPGRNQKQAKAPPSEEESSFYDYYDDEASLTSDDIAKLEALDASSFLNVNSHEVQRPPPLFPSMTYKKTVPAPIKIPSAAFRGAKVQLIHSSAGSQGKTRPSSQASIDELSALSGSTLARALMANSFVLSSDHASRHRSGASSIVQMDSATLPAGEHPFLGSPMIRDRTLSWNPSASPNTPGLVPPVPTNAELVYSPPLHFRREDKPKPSERTGSVKRRSRDSDSLAYFKSPDASMPNDSVPSERLHCIVETSPTIEAPRFADNDSTSVDATAQTTTTRPESVGASSMPQAITPSTATSSTSEKDIGGVLDYYELPISPEPGTTNNGFKLPFSPISEESTSQLSPPALFVEESQRNSRCPSMIVSSSASSGIGRIEWLTRRESFGSAQSPADDKASRLSSLLPIGGRPRSAQFSPDASTASLYSTSSATPSPGGPLSPPPPPRSIFNRERSGSAPSPIRVVRDSSDLQAYNIMVNPLSTPRAALLTFPQTPDLFSPTYSNEVGHDSHTPDDVPQTPNSAFAFQYRNSGMPSITQQVLLTRAGSGARHSRMGSISRTRSVATAPTGNLHAIIPENNSQESLKRSIFNGSPLPSVKDKRETPEGTITSHPDASSSSLRSHHTFGGPSSSGRMPNVTLSRPGTPSEEKGLPSLPISPAGSIDAGMPTALPAIHIPSNEDYSPRQRRTRRSPTITVAHSDVPLVVPPPPPLPPPLPPSSPALSDAVQSQQATRLVTIPPPPPVIPPPLPLQEQPARRYPTDPIGHDRESNYSISIGSPPPYYTVVYEQPNSGTPSTGSSGHEHDPRFAPRQSMSSTFTVDSPSTATARRRTTRAPIGPRGPSQHNRERSSISSVSVPSSTRRTFSAALPSPRFVTPAPKWRGYTLDAAKWTFTSSQLQAIVAHAIRQSAESSSIRLLRQETADVEVPMEIDRLEKRRTDVKTRYKLFARRRAELLDSLSTAVSDNAILALRFVDDLKEVSGSMDKLAEELHSIDEQVAQLNTLVQVHSASALAMALRKLNASFLKEFANTRVLREQIQELETDRDEAWKHCEDAASDLDNLRKQITSSEDPNRRSSHISAVRKSSIRASKAGLSNHRLSSATFSGAKSAFSIDSDIPPDINTDIPTRSSMGLSTDGFTPTSETRAMVRAHEELCEMLGITMNDTRPKRRPRSLIIPPRENEEIPIDRPNSLPAGSRLSEAYNAMIVDRQAILTTLEMLSD
ncbi:hypothetical protein BDZ89DRAFT_1065306 [Hymenopellis radicata]|nr:hypothetical protein BDZ89DRAFT_1065306 [Hymenopellis radicata]